MAALRADYNDKVLSLNGDLEDILSSRRTVFNLESRGATITENSIVIPVEESDLMEVLTGIERLFESNGHTVAPGDNLGKLIGKYFEARGEFEVFSKKAQSIRDNKIIEHSLVEEFSDFTTSTSKNLKRTLYPLQLLSAYHLAFSRNACNFAVPGSGKTTIVYAAFSYLKQVGVVDRLVVIGPLASFQAWEREYFECFGKNAESKRLDGASTTPSERIQILNSPVAPELLLMHYDSIERVKEHLEHYISKHRVMVVIDEAHRIKAKDGIRSSHVLDLASGAKARVILTGTPIPHGYQDLYNLIKFIWPHRYKDILSFHYGNLVEMSKNKEIDTPRVQRLIKNVSPYFITIKKSDLHLPDAVNNAPTVVEMGPQQKQIYDFIEEKYVKQMQESDGRASLKEVLNKAKLIRLRQAATNPSLLRKPLDSYYHELGLGDSLGLDDSNILEQVLNYSEVPAKFIATRHLLEELLNANQKIIIWTIFVQNAKNLQSYLLKQKIKAELLIGEVDTDSREKIINEFDNPDSSLKVVIANPFAVGESISLHHGCHNAIYLERDYNAGNYLQSRDRIHRYGLSPGVVTNYYFIQAAETIDGIIDEKLRDKIKRLEHFMKSDIPLLTDNIDYQEDETDIVKALLEKYANRD